MTNLVIPPDLARNKVRDPEAVVDAAVWLISHMCEHVGVPDLGEVDVLDFGCGFRFTQAFLDRGVPIGHYTGVDVSREIIDFLQQHVTDARFDYHHLDARNDRYNPGGQPLSTLTVPGIEGRAFDLICLFSVFTHLDPDDYSAMLRLLRRFARPETKLFFTVFINERTIGGHGYVDRLEAALHASTDPDVHARLAATAPNETPDFVDALPDQPLLAALYSRKHAIELIDGTGWTIESISPPDVHLQHHIMCTPA